MGDLEIVCRQGGLHLCGKLGIIFDEQQWHDIPSA
jgi:hypothetical protein